MLLKVDGKQVYAATGGRTFDAGKPAIVFLHGAGLDHTVWQLPARSFAWHGHSVLAPDLPGHGRSEGPALGSVADMAAWVGRLLDAAGCGKPRWSDTPWAAPLRSRPPQRWASGSPAWR